MVGEIVYFYEDWSKEDEFFHNNEDSKVWEIILNKVNSVVDEIFY